MSLNLISANTQEHLVESELTRKLPPRELMVNLEGDPRRKGEWRRIAKTPKHRIAGTLVCENCGKEFDAKTYQIRRNQRFCSGDCRFPTDEQKFWKSVNKTPECWEWIGPLVSGRYGNAIYKLKAFLAHRLSWILHFGEIPEGMVVCHKCDNIKCVNPDHLFIGTQGDNVRDMFAKGRNQTGVLSDEDVRSIRESSKSRDELVAHYSVSRRTINDIITKRVRASA